MKKLVLGIVLVLTCATSSYAQNAVDGTFWVELPDSTEKLMYTTGLLDGVSSFLPLAMTTRKTLVAKEEQVVEAIGTTIFLMDKVIGRITAQDIRDGLDAFFSDYKNRRIKVSAAAVIVVAELGGVPKQDIDKWVEAFRSAAIK